MSRVTGGRSEIAVEFEFTGAHETGRQGKGYIYLQEPIDGRGTPSRRYNLLSVLSIHPKLRKGERKETYNE